MAESLDYFFKKALFKNTSFNFFQMLCFFSTVHKIKYISLSSWLSNPGRNQSSHINRSHVHHNPSIWLRDKKMTERWGWLWQFFTTALLWWELVLVLFSVWEVGIPTDFRWSMEGFQSFLEIQENWGWASVWCCLIWRTSDSWSCLRCRTTYCKTANHSISSQTVITQRDSADISDVICEGSWRSHRIDILDAGGTVVKEGHAGERMAQNMPWCDAMRGFQVQHCLHHVHKHDQVSKFRRDIFEIHWSDGPDLKHGRKLAARLGSVALLRVSSFLCVSWCCNVTYMQTVIQRSQPACPSLPWCSIFFYWSLHDQRLYKCESLFRVASCGQNKRQ